MKKIAIIGNSDYIEDDIVQLYLNNYFEVKVSTNDISKKEQYEHLMLLDNADRLYIAELNTQNKQHLIDFVIDCDAVTFTNISEFDFNKI